MLCVIEHNLFFFSTAEQYARFVRQQMQAVGFFFKLFEPNANKVCYTIPIIFFEEAFQPVKTFFDMTNIFRY